MSGVEALGALASASQIAAYSIKIVLFLDEIYTEARSRPNQTREHLNQVRELIQITNLIERRESLRSSVIHAQLQKTLAKARALYDVLRDLSITYAGNTIWRVWTVLSGVGDKVILAGLNNLEREKSALRLCISLVHTDLLLSIQGSLNTPPTREMSPNPSLDSTAIDKETGNINDETTLVKFEAERQSDENPPERPATTSKVERDTAVSTNGHYYGEVLLTNGGNIHVGDMNGKRLVKDAKSHTFQKVCGNGKEGSKFVVGNINSKTGIECFFNHPRK